MPKRTKPDDLDMPSLITVRAETASKCGKGATGRLSYAVAYHPEQKEVYLRLTANEGGGLFNPEWVPLAAIEKALDGPPLKREPFRSKLLASAFTGRSNNNAGFLAAVLRAEHLLKAAEKSEFQHQFVGDLQAYRRQIAKQAQSRRGRQKPGADDEDVAEEPEGETT